MKRARRRGKLSSQINQEIGDSDGELCDFTSSDISSLRGHVRNVHDIGKSAMEKKEKQDASSKLAVIKESHLKTHLCGLCPSTMSTRQDLYTHLTYYHKFEIDENEGSFRCDQQNNRKHESIKSFKCQLCDYATNNNGKLNKHMEKAHDNEIQESDAREETKSKIIDPEETSDFTCGICHVSFPDEAALFSHLREDNHDFRNEQSFFQFSSLFISFARLQHIEN